jgi:hypothetical protein
MKVQPMRTGMAREIDGPIKKKRVDALAINCYRGDEVLAKLGMRSDTTVGRLYAELRVDAWNRVLEEVLGDG